MLLSFKIKKAVLYLFILVLFINAVSAVTDEDIRIALKKALYEYFENPDTATLTLDQIRDLIDLYLNTPPGTDPVDLSGVAINSGTTMDIVYNKAAAITTLIPTCSDGTEYGECDFNNKPNYCSNGNIIANCGGYDGCGCPAGQECQTDGTCMLTCADGTVTGFCSSTQPLYCDATLTLVDDCSTCSCPADQICQVDGLCTITLPKPASLGNIPEDAAIIFWSTRNIQGAQVLFPSNLYTMNIDGSKITQITFGLKGFGHAAVSPNHKYIVAGARYEKNYEQRDGVWLFDLENQTEQQLLPNFYQVGVGGVDWLGNEWIYMQAREQKPLQPEDIGKSYIYKIRPDGTGLTRITNDDTVFETDVSVSEDGTLIAFVKNIETTDAQGNLCYDPQIWSANADGSNIQVIDISDLPCGVQGTDAIGNFDPEISPDNKFVVFSRTNTQVPKNFKDTLNTAHDIWIAPLDKSSPARRITPQGAISIIPDWHNDKILYTVYYESIDDLNNYVGLATINTDGTNEQRLEPSYANIWDGGRHGKWIPLVLSTSTTKWTDFANPQIITIAGYTGHAMEPGISKDGNLLFFNNNTINGDEDLLWAVYIDDTTFQYMGEVGNVNNLNVVDGTPSMDMIGNLYYTSLVSYGTDSKSLYSGAFNVVNGVGSVANPQVLEGNIYEGISPWASVDIDVSPTGNTIYYAEGKFDTAPPSSFNVRVANKNVEGKYIRDDSILTNINTNDREYAPSISFDGKVLFFTRSKGVPPNPITAEIFIAKRDSISEPFGIPVKIDAIAGFVEGPTITADGKTLYYHKNDGGVFKIYKATRQQYKAVEGPYEKIAIQYDGNPPVNGIYDSSIEYGPDGTGWLAYSAVYGGRVPFGPYVETRLAKSTDNGASWQFEKVINPSYNANFVDSLGNTITGNWNYEVSSLVYDPTDVLEKRWKLFSHHIFAIPSSPSLSQPQYSWISYRYASDPAGTWSPEEALLGAGPTPFFPFNNFPVSPRIKINDLHPDLNYAMYSEPGTVVADSTLYMSLTAITSSPQAIVLLASNDLTQTWQYVGKLLTNVDAQLLGYDSFDGSSLVEANGRYYLLVSPKKEGVGTYIGTFIIEIEDISLAKIKRDTEGTPVLLAYIIPDPAVYSGNAGESDYDVENTAGGVIFPQLNTAAGPEIFQIFNTKYNLP